MYAMVYPSQYVSRCPSQYVYHSVCHNIWYELDDIIIYDNICDMLLGKIHILVTGHSSNRPEFLEYNINVTTFLYDSNLFHWLMSAHRGCSRGDGHPVWLQNKELPEETGATGMRNWWNGSVSSRTQSTDSRQNWTPPWLAAASGWGFNPSTIYFRILWDRTRNSGRRCTSAAGSIKLKSGQTIRSNQVSQPCQIRSDIYIYII